MESMEININHTVGFPTFPRWPRLGAGVRAPLLDLSGRCEPPLNPAGHHSKQEWTVMGNNLLVLGREFSGMIHFTTSNNNPSNPQQPIHSLRKTHQ